MENFNKRVAIIFCLAIFLGLTGMQAGAADKAAAKIDINKATVAELTALSGIGDAIAARIIEYREANGPFKAPEDLMKVKGIGEKKFEKIKDLIVAVQPKKK